MKNMCAEVSTSNASAISAAGYRKPHVTSTTRGPRRSISLPRKGATTPSPSTYSALAVPAATKEFDREYGGFGDPGRKFRGHKVTKAETADYCERVLRGFLERREPGENFAAYVARAEEAWLL